MKQNLGTLRCWIHSDDVGGDHQHRVEVSDCWDRGRSYSHCHPVLAKAVDGALRKFFGIFDKDAETLITAYSASCQAVNGSCVYRVSLTLAGGRKLKATAPSEGLAVFATLWRHYQLVYSDGDAVLMGTLAKQLDSVE